MKYRAEIDGLRALAVIPVILFHAKFELFSGGFVGVDIFFVISGYLITKILLDEIGNNQFSIINFYERRARRILPALFFILLNTIALAWIFMTPNQVKSLSQSLIAVSLFISNILFWGDSGYFSTAAELKPLLHTWSLAVEEQYYLLFPIFLLLFWRLGRRNLFWLILAISVISLALSEWGWRNYPKANFYLAPTRAWELLAGSIAAFIINKKGLRSNNTLSLIGLCAVIFSIFMYTKKTPFPSAYALLPVMGTVLIVLFADKKTWTARILSNKPLVGIGLISYSAYLWHQPLFAFARIRTDGQPSATLYSFLTILTLLLAYLTWKYIEKPFRNANTISNRSVFTFSLIFMIGFVSFGLYGYHTNGLRHLMVQYKYGETTEDKKYYNALFKALDYDMYNNMYLDDCKLWSQYADNINIDKLNKCHARYGKTIIVLGDSHAMNLYNIIAKSNQYNFIIGLSRGGCRPHNNHHFCHYKSFENFLKSHKEKISKILYHQSGAYYIKDKTGKVDSQLAFEGQYGSIHKENILTTRNYLKKIENHYSLKVIWVGPFLEYRFNPLSMYGKRKPQQINPNSIEVFKILEQYLTHFMSEEKQITYISFSEIFYEPEDSYIQGCFVFRDSNHYSRCGEAIIASKFIARKINE